MQRSYFERRAIALILGLGLFLVGYAIGTGTTTASAQQSCHARSSPMSAGDLAMAREEYDKAIASYESESKTTGNEGERAHNALIRAMIAANKLSEAQAATTAWATAAPTDAWSKNALGEVLLRRGDVAGAEASLRSALTLDPCNSQTRADLARIYELSAMFATAKRNLDDAHALDPVDDEITRRWIFAQPEQAQLDALEKYLSHSSFLTDVERAKLVRIQKRLGLALGDPCRLSTDFSHIMIPYYAVENGPKARVFWGLLVTINGKPMRLQFNSLISGILLARTPAEKLHVQPEDGAEVEGVGSLGDMTAKVAKVDTIQLASLTFNHCDVQIMPTDLRVDSTVNINRYTEYGSDGFIGPDALQDFLVTLDMPGHELRLDALPEPAGAITHEFSLTTGVAPAEHPLHDRYVDLSMKNWAQIFRDDQYLIVPSKFKQGTAALFGIATSSILDSISMDLAKQVASVGSNPHELPKLSNKGSSVFYETSATTLAYAGVITSFDHMSALDNSAWSNAHGLEIGGFLGKPNLRGLTIHIDYRDNLLRLDFDPKRVVNCGRVNLPDCY
jgi:hypothetical protein